MTSSMATRALYPEMTTVQLVCEQNMVKQSSTVGWIMHVHFGPCNPAFYYLHLTHDPEQLPPEPGSVAAQETSIF